MRAHTVLSPSTWSPSRRLQVRLLGHRLSGHGRRCPIMGTLRRIPWLEKTALVFCDLYTEEGEPVGGQPAPHPPAPGRPGGQAGLPDHGRLGARALPVQGVARRGAREAVPRADARLASTSRTTTSSRRPRRRAWSGAIRNGMEVAAVPVEFSKGEWGCGQEEINLALRRACRDGGSPRSTSTAAKEIAHGQGSSDHRSWRSTTWARRASSFHLHSEPVGLEPGRKMPLP